MKEHQEPELNTTRTTLTSRPSSAEQSTQDYYFENGFLVFTAAYHLKRGGCCGSGCRHWPFEPKNIAGTKTTAPKRKTA